MKDTFIVDYVDSEGIEISRPMVLKSAAGFYIGTMYREHGCEGPNSRESGYYGSAEEAKKDLSNYRE